MRESDAEAVLALWDAAGQEIHGGADGFSEAEAANVRRVLQLYPRHADAMSFVVEEGDGLSGFILAYKASHPIYSQVHPNGPGLGEIEEYYLHPALRPTPVAAQLVDTVVAEMQKRGVAVIHVHASLDWPAGREFWTKQGWYADTTMFSWYAN
jgi:ribosomal protein S18 acetylase RimI-like enzyme